MLDPTSYAIALFAETESVLPETVVALDVLGELVRQKKPLLTHLTPNQLVQAAKRHIRLGISVQHLIHLLYKNRDLKLLPRIAASFRRLLNMQGLPVVDVTYVQTIDHLQIEQHFAPHTVIIYHTDPSLIAGLRIATSSGTAEYSLDSILRQIRQAITRN